MSNHVVPVKTYVLVFAALIALTSFTTGVAFIDLGRFNTVAALLIAVSKAVLVILFFMHLRYSPHMTRIVVVAGFFWLAILITLTLSDFRTRKWTPAPTGWETSTSLPRSSGTKLPTLTRAVTDLPTRVLGERHNWPSSFAFARVLYWRCTNGSRGYQTGF
jgi:cytochrome c oxidase subunit 4